MGLVWKVGVNNDIKGSSIELKLVFFVVNKEEQLDDVLTAFIEADVPGATILDSEGMGRFLTYEVPLFASFKQFMKGSRPYNKTIFSLVENDEKVDRLVALIEKVVGSLSEPGTGILFTVEVDRVFGLRATEN